MKHKLSYIIIPLLVIAVGALGSMFTGVGMDWYSTLTLPQGTPPGSFIGIVWTIIYLCCIVSLLFFWNTKHDKRFTLILRLFIVNGLLNAFWNRFFFVQHRLLFSFIVIIVLFLLTVTKMILLYPRSKGASLFLLLYPIWLIIAGSLAYGIWILN